MQLYHNSSSLVVTDDDRMYGRFFSHSTSTSDPFFDCIGKLPPAISLALTTSSFHPYDRVEKSGDGDVEDSSSSVVGVSSSDGSSDKRVNLFCEVYGIFGNLTKRFADRMDFHQVPCEGSCVIPDNYLVNNFSYDVLASIAEENDFWSGVPIYPWTWAIFSEFFSMCDGRVYLLADWEFGEQLTDRYIWIKKNFGSLMSERTIFTDDGNRQLLPKSRRDILVDGDLANGEAWLRAGGSFFYWSECHWGCVDRAKIISKRLRVLHMVTAAMKKY